MKFCIRLAAAAVILASPVAAVHAQDYERVFTGKATLASDLTSYVDALHITCEIPYGTFGAFLKTTRYLPDDVDFKHRLANSVALELEAGGLPDTEESRLFYSWLLTTSSIVTLFIMKDAQAAAPVDEAAKRCAEYEIMSRGFAPAIRALSSVSVGAELQQ